MTHVWKIVEYVDVAVPSNRHPRRYGRAIPRSTSMTTRRERIVVQVHSTEEDANEALKNFPGAVVERERIRLDLDN